MAQLYKSHHTVLVDELLKNWVQRFCLMILDYKLRGYIFTTPSKYYKFKGIFVRWQIS